MRKLILQEFLTLEGFAAGPGNSVDFVPAATKDDRSFGLEQLALMDEVDTISARPGHVREVRRLLAEYQGRRKSIRRQDERDTKNRVFKNP
jgi:hypothetical protein